MRIIRQGDRVFLVDTIVYVVCSNGARYHGINCDSNTRMQGRIAMREVKKFVRQKLLARPRYRAQTTERNKSGDVNLVVVSHEATLTGAPKIILRLLQEFASLPKVSCRTLLHNGGALVDDFREHSDVYMLDTKRKLVPHVGRMIRKSTRSLDRSKPTVALVNSAESRFIAKSLQDAGIPIVSLIHELPNSYEPEDFRLIESTSNQIVFPSQFVDKAAHSFVEIPRSKTQIMPQGLLDRDFGTRFERATAKRELASELGISRDAKVVIGCGTIDLRKGVDHFARAAHALIKNHDSQFDTHFIWLGGGPQHKHTPYHYVHMDLLRAGIDDRVHFLGERSNVEPYFMAADAALMMSREDPFPCVVHEAMACGLPMITFADAGGAPEALADGAGIVVPYGDTHQVAAELYRLTHKQDYYDHISQRACDRVRSHYDFRDYAARIAQLLSHEIGTDLGYETGRMRRIAA